MSGPIVLPFVTTYDDKGAKKADLSLKGLMKTQLGMGVSAAMVAQQIGKAVKAFSEDEAQQKQLALAVQNSTGASNAQVKAIEDTIQSMQFQKAVSDGELRPALSTLVRATGDVTKAQSLLNLALDISAGTGKDLQAVSIALAKAQGGNVTALTRLGVSLDANAVKTKDFDAITRELSYTFKGAADAAANSAEGGFKKLQIAVDELYETVGGKLAPVLGDYATAASKIAQATIGAEGQTSGWSNKLFELVTRVLPATQQIGFLNAAVKGYAGTAKGAVTETRNLSRQFRAFEGQMMSAYENGLKPTKAELEATKRAQQAAGNATAEHTKKLKDFVKSALATAKDGLKSAREEMDNFSNSQKEAITGFVSLSDAVKTQTDSEDAYQDALRRRTEAYDALNQASAAKDAQAYADALTEVANAEVGVTKAQQDRKSYGAAFAEQIASAKKFAENLQTLVGKGLEKEGLAQLLNLGPVAGVQVTNELIAGTGSLTVKGLNDSLASLSATAGTFGASAGQAFFGGNVAAQEKNVSTVNNFNIQVQALAGNELEVAKKIVAALQVYQKKVGKVPITVG
jgi:hypothetical protein